MYTLHNMLGWEGKVGVKWQSDTQSASPDIPEHVSAKKALQDLKDYKDDDTRVLMRLINALHDANENLRKKNQALSLIIEKDMEDSII